MISEDFFKDKDILVTGGAGSIGSEIIRQLVAFPIKRVRALDNSESGLFVLSQKISSDKLRLLVGDIRDKKRLKTAMKDVDIVFHCAALKHVPLSEYNPFEAVATNVIGTQNVLEAAREEGVERFIGVSTDKVVDPVNTMGATKLLSEKLIFNAPIGDSKTLFSCVRFGNVLDSSGSVVPIFRDQIQKGGPVTLTSEEMVRFFMSIPEAVNLVLRAAKMTKGREIFIFKMRTLKIRDLAEIMIEELSTKFSRQPENIKIEIIGIRPGEKLYESLMTEEEAKKAIEMDDLFILRPKIIQPHYIEKENGYTGITLNKYHAQHADLLSKEDIREMVRSIFG